MDQCALLRNTCRICFVEQIHETANFHGDRYFWAEFGIPLPNDQGEDRGSTRFLRRLTDHTRQNGYGANTKHGYCAYSDLQMGPRKAIDLRMVCEQPL